MGFELCGKDIRKGQRRARREQTRVKYKRSIVEIQYTFCKSASYDEKRRKDDNHDDEVCDK